MLDNKTNQNAKLRNVLVSNRPDRDVAVLNVVKQKLLKSSQDFLASLSPRVVDFERDASTVIKSLYTVRGESLLPDTSTASEERKAVISSWSCYGCFRIATTPTSTWVYVLRPYDE